MSLWSSLRSLWDPLGDLLAQIDANVPSPTTEAYLKQLRLQLKRNLGALYPGDVRGLFKGQGMDLQNIREYQPGDEIRKMDWNVLARTGVPHVKEHYQERQVPVWLVVDATDPMHFGQRQTKLAYAQQLVELLGLMVLDQGHRLGLVVWTGTEKPVVIPPKQSAVQLPLVLNALVEAQTPDVPPSLPVSFPDLGALFKERAFVVVCSDFAFLDTFPDAAKQLASLARKHQVYTLLLVDPVEQRLTHAHGWLPLGDSAGSVWVNTDNRWLVKAYRKRFAQMLAERRKGLMLWGRCWTVQTDEPPVQAILRLVRAA